MEKQDVNGTVPDESLQFLAPVTDMKKIVKTTEMGKVAQP